MVVVRSLVMVALLAAGCGSGSGSTKDGGGGSGGGGGGAGGGAFTGTASCAGTQSITQDGQTLIMRVCIEWTGLSAPQAEAYRLGCGAATVDAGGASQQRVFSNAPCSHDGALGACRVSVGGVTQANWYYDDDLGVSLDEIQQICAQQGGTFLAP